MKIFYLSLLSVIICGYSADAQDMQLGGRIESRAVSTSPRAYAQDHFKRRAGANHRYENWRYNYGDRPNRFHSGYGWEEHRPMTYPYMQYNYSSPNVVVRQPIIVHETVNIHSGQSSIMRTRQHDQYYTTDDHHDIQGYNTQEYDNNLPWVNDDGFAEDVSHPPVEDFYPDNRGNAPYEPQYMTREIVTSPEQESLRHHAPTDPLSGLWNAIGLGYE